MRKKIIHSQLSDPVSQTTTNLTFRYTTSYLYNDRCDDLATLKLNKFIVNNRCHGDRFTPFGQAIGSNLYSFRLIPRHFYIYTPPPPKKQVL